MRSIVFSSGESLERTPRGEKRIVSCLKTVLRNKWETGDFLKKQQ